MSVSIEQRKNAYLHLKEHMPSPIESLQFQWSEQERYPMTMAYAGRIGANAVIEEPSLFKQLFGFDLW